MPDAIEPFVLSVPESDLLDLKARLSNARWPDAETVGDWGQGVPLEKMRALCDYWASTYDWRRCEAALNALGQYRTMIDGLDIHFLHIRSPQANALPVIMTHGWPGSVMEFMSVIGPLTDPAAHGGDPADACHLVIPSLPGYGFSGKPVERGWNVDRTARAWAVLMKRLGYDRWVSQGGDWGSVVTRRIGEQQPEGCIGIHMNMAFVPPTAEDLETLTPQEQAILGRAQHYERWESGYAKQQATRPQTLGYGLTDSPVGQAAWIYEKLHAWTDNDGTVESAVSMDHALDNIMLYWLTASATSSARLYWESLENAAGYEPITLPAGLSIFPKELFLPSRRWTERAFRNLVYWNETAAGGHFAAWEKPEIFIDELRKCFRLFRA